MLAGWGRLTSIDFRYSEATAYHGLLLNLRRPWFINALCKLGSAHGEGPHHICRLHTLRQAVKLIPHGARRPQTGFAPALRRRRLGRGGRNGWPFN